MGKKLTLADFAKKATDKYNNRKMTIEVEIEGMGGTVTFTRPSQNDLLVYMSKNTKAIKSEIGDNGKSRVAEMDFVLMTDAAVTLVYNSCAFLHDAEFQKSLGVVDPYDIVLKVFSTDKLMEIANQISDEFNNNDEVIENIKN
ncbi:hypothetical protein [Clostridium sp.]|uniref:hypothetical protein n=1 Tax=Clostridium sp. TaxID=1506 RepID=UPI003F4BF404